MENSHPEQRVLFAFAQGKLDAERIEEVAKHIEQCATCVDFLEDSLDDTLVDQLRDASDDRSFESSFGGSFEVKYDTEPVSDGVSLENHPKYEILKEIGAGGMGAVFKAAHKVMDREVAIKVIRKEFVSNREAVARFHNEVRAAAKLAHRNIVTAYDAEQVGDTHFLVMEFVVGESLAATVKRRGPLPVMHSCNYILQVANGLKHAHEKGMIHRDIKPQNLMKTPKGIIKILDFGLARINDIGDEDSQLTTTGVMMGTADYISPEQARSARDADIRSDLYSLGCTFYFLLTAKPPFPVPNRVDKIMAHCSQEIPDLRTVRSDLPDPIWKIIEKLVAKNPDDRYQNPQELITDLTPHAKPGPEKDIVDPDRTLVGNAPAVPVPATPRASEQATEPLPTLSPLQPENAQDESSRPPFELPLLTGLESHDSGQTSVTNPLPSGSILYPSPSRSSQRRSQPFWKYRAFQVSLATVGAILLVWIIYAVAFSGGSSNTAKNDNPADDKKDRNGSGRPFKGKQKSNGTGKRPAKSGQSGNASSGRTVLVYFGYEPFCFGDFGPLSDALQNAGYSVVAVSDSAREATYIRNLDDGVTEGKHDLSIQFGINNQFVNSIQNCDGIVFIGGSPDAAVFTDPESSAATNLVRLVSKIRQQNGWVAAVGTGINIPNQLGLFDDTDIVRSPWIRQQKTGGELVDGRVHVDQGRRVVTGVDWTDSAEVGRQLANQF